MANTDRGYGPLCNHMYMYDLGWLVETILSFREELDTAIDLKTIHYADPIQWDITTQYSPNTVVVDPKTGTAYMSKVPVPAGVQLDNSDYWVVIFNYQRIYDKIMSGVAFNDKENAEASKDISKYDFVWYGGDLYQAQRDIPQGTKYVPGVNIVAATIADALATYYGRDRVAQVINDTLTASETQTIGAKNRVINVTGDQTVTAGDIAETSANRTIKTTADYHIDVDGNLSDHVDGVTTVNRGGAVTEAYGSSLDVGVTGTYTAEYSGTVTEKYKNKKNVSAKDILYTFPDKKMSLNHRTVNIKDFGAVGDGSTDDYQAFADAVAATQNGDTIFCPSGHYFLSRNPYPISEHVISNDPADYKNWRTWLISPGCVFSGGGIGTPNSGRGTFASPFSTQPWITVSGKNEIVNYNSIPGNSTGDTVIYTDALELAPIDTSQSPAGNRWVGLEYRGACTGKQGTDNNKLLVHLLNQVLNLTGTRGICTEIDINDFTTKKPEGFTIGLFITGEGDGAGADMAGIDIQRGGTTKWVNGVSVNNCLTGFYAGNDCERQFAGKDFQVDKNGNIKATSISLKNRYVDSYKIESESKTFSNDQMYTIPLNVPGGYKYIAASELASNGFVGQMYIAGHTDTELQIYVKQGGTGTISAMVIIAGQ